MDDGTQSPLPANGNHFQRYLQYASSLLDSYKGNEPLHLFLKKYFSSNKKHGSRDRKMIASLCYDYFRLGHGVSLQIPMQEKLLLASFLCETKASLFPGFLDGERDVSIQSPLNQKLAIAVKQFEPEKLFPFANELSDQINHQQFSLSFLVQPKLFIRIRPGFKEIVINKIRQAGIPYQALSESCLSFANNEKITTVIDVDTQAVVQDYSSQRTLSLAEPVLGNHSSRISVWDCCAGSGGKSILAVDILGNVNLTVSDNRKNILENLEGRFKKAGFRNYKLVLADLQLPLQAPHDITGPFDLIVADVPCTGSGTWSRTPEQLAFFRKKDIEAYSSMQKRIVENIVSRLSAKGYFLYITCSVFTKENEENVDFIRQKYNLELIGMEYLKGYEIQADTLFMALFRNAGP